MVRNLMRHPVAPPYPCFGVLGPKRPEAYRLLLDDFTVYVIGPYLSNCGGCDAVGSMDKIIELVTKYHAKGDVIFEGLLISSMYGSIGTFLEHYKKQAIVAFLTTSEERCRTQLGIRQASGRAKGDKTFMRHYGGTQKVKARMLEDGILRVEDLDPDRSVEQITRWLIR